MNTMRVTLLSSASTAAQTQALPASISLQYEVLAIVGLLIALVFVCLWLRRTAIKYRALSEEHDSMTARFRNVIDIEVEKQRVVGELEAERRRLQGDIERAQEQRKQSEAEVHE